jgi:hypothetical protein
MTTANRVRFLDHKGRRIVLIDFSGTDPVQGKAVTDEALRVIATLPRDGSALTLTDVTGTTYTRQSIERMKQLTSHNKPYVKAAAVVSTSAIHRASITMVAIVSRRNLEVFDTRQKAMDWLATQ